jgi:hypothetical protein
VVWWALRLAPRHLADQSAYKPRPRGRVNPGQVDSRSTASCGPPETHQSSPIETTFETTAKNAGAQLGARPAFGLVRLAVAAGFEPAEGCPSRAFEFCGWWFRPVRLGLVAPEPRLGSPLRTPLNLRE